MFLVCNTHLCFLFFFFFNDTATTEIYTLSLHDALPICQFLTESLVDGERSQSKSFSSCARIGREARSEGGSAGMPRPISYAVFCLKKKNTEYQCVLLRVVSRDNHHVDHICISLGLVACA